MEFITMIGVIILVFVSISINARQKGLIEQNKMLFKVQNKFSGKTFNVYSIKKVDSDRTEFLIYENNEWKWVLNDIYLPYEAE
ncbi:hypothetical protein LGQ02_10290 [Bacillus shivajii]|uniref:hypothetical protein n=1 Tax=Bacillus shivajii TaxID=1983719 RepID=UPI001CFC22A7|nr:hypothetical protein [Bacillus shivajii]UCZ55081.1 hypothetical protein LGQ02_10290 [Bacillus shivajii]